MDLSQIRTVVRRYVQDTGSVEWSDAEVNQNINDAYYDLQMELQMSNPEAIIAWDTIKLNNDDDWYPKPPTFGIIQIGIKTAASDTSFKRIFPKNYEDILPETGGGPADTFYYAERGDWFAIFPRPTTAVEDGIQVVHRPIDTLTADTDVPKLKLPLHQAICLQAKVFMLSDTNEDAARDEAKLITIKERMPLLYMGSVDQQQLISPRGL
jgi:hypothetical protein